MIHLNPRWSKQETSDLLALGQWALAQDSSLKDVSIFATSGTTASSVSRTKLVLLQSKALEYSARMVNAKFDFGKNDIWLNPLPSFHVGGYGILKRAEISEAQCFLFQEKWNPNSFYTELIDKKISVTSLVPTQVFDLVQAKLKAPANLKLIFVGGAALNAELLGQAQNLGWPLVMTYGMTETSSMIAVSSLEKPSIIEFFPEVDFKISKTNQILSIKSKCLLSAYAYYDEQGQKRYLDPKQEAWFETSDRVAYDVNLGLQIIGRTSDQVKILGEVVDLSQLRKLLTELLGQQGFSISSAYLDSLPDDRMGNKIVVYFDQSAIASVDVIAKIVLQLDNLVRPYEKVHQAYLVEQIPKNDLGKVLISSLRSAKRTEVKYEPK